MQDFEKLGAFYLGRLYDPERQAPLEDLLLYDAKDLTTHAVCLGMTGSGKTGLCLALLEEAAIDGVPALAIDPKGDLGNLLLSFPGLEAADFRPWIDEDAAARKGMTPDEYATHTAELWRRGLAEWGQDGERIARFRESVELSLYTPGSRAGAPLRVLRSFAAPPPALLADEDALRDRVQATVSGLLTLLGVNADPIRSREHILLSSILDRAWREGRDLDLGALIQEIQSPPFDRIGVLDLESFFPAGDRFALAMILNNLLASPGFAAWREGEPLDIGRLLYTPEGKPRLTILSIAHLSDPERMFFVTVLLNELVAWMRTQSGTTSLRALLYMDEVFGYLPPTANPPSKIPLLTLLKQARAYGLGVVLATQNPVDLDYKALSNAGTWFLGRLQTERDKARVLEGLEGISAGGGLTFDRPKLEATLAGLKSRVFLMNNVHDTGPALFHTRWALSYLRGPLTREQIRRLVADRPAPLEPPAAAPAPGAPSRPAASPAAPERAPSSRSSRPVVPPEIPQAVLPVVEGPGAGERLVYRPALLGSARLHWAQARLEVDEWGEATLLAPLSGRMPANPWSGAEELVAGLEAVGAEPVAGASWAALPAAASRPRSYTSWSKALKSELYRSRALALWRCRQPKAISRPGETEGEFRVRVGQLAHEARDLALEKLRRRYAPKVARIEERIRVAEQRVGREAGQYRQQKVQTAISLGATVLGALFGRKMASTGTVGRASTTARGMARAGREKADIARARETLETQRGRLGELETELREAVEALKERFDPAAVELKAVPVRPRKTDLEVDDLRLAWAPWVVDEAGLARPAYR